MTKDEFNKAVANLIPDKLKDQFRELKKKFDAANPLVSPAPGTSTTPTPSGNCAMLSDGTQITYDTPTLQVGSKLMTVPSDGTGAVKTPAGNYTLQDGTQLTVDENGAVTALTPAAAATPPASDGMASQMVSYNVDGGQPVFTDISDDGIADIDPGDMVYSDAAMTTPYPDGTYKITGTDFGFTVAGGIVTAVTDPDGLGAGAPASGNGMMQKAFSKIRTKILSGEKKFSAISKENETLKTELAEVKKQFGEFLEVFSAVVEIPTAKPIQTPKNTFADKVNNKAKILSQFNKK